jgi:hypothetical protein
VPNFKKSIGFLKKNLGNFNLSDYILDQNADFEMKQKQFRMTCNQEEKCTKKTS